ncbi:hypothetical protein FEM33_01685 [Dyadobacter flavalbus]|uniref:Tape measure protein N-terminal domain-containing protein n=1 Tax=Dyadobacter flavalbus TaxID=2579942 RepID=A0A5M8R5N7_9BACT|nr:tape measure protein [Dyadobacter flavalbus]KAA6441472.1 hypothetical protein FEM33_01685 [Dyadobacter flavalbus]
MNNNNGALSFDATIANSQFQKSITEMQNSIRGLATNVQNETKGIDSAFQNLGRIAAGAFAFNELRQLPGKLIEVRGEFQQLEIAFNTMLGSKTKADKLFADVVKLAATTPFDLKGVASGAKQLLAYGVASQDVTATLTKLGDIAAGLSIPLGDLTYLYGTTRTQGRLFAADLNQFVGRGIPLIALLAEQFKVTEGEVKGLVEQGKVGFPEVEKAINKLTSSGGMFAGLMAEQSKSLTGLYANFQDAVEQAFNQVGKSQEGILGDSLKFGTAVVQNYQPILDVLTVLVATYGTYRAAIIATSAIQSLAASQGAIKSFFALAGSIRSAADAQALFNLVTKANPYVIAATALVSLITAVALFRDTATEAQKAQERLNGEIEKADKIDIERKIKVDQLRKSIQDENLSQEERKRKLQELIALSPSHLSAINAENIATAESTKAIEDYITAAKERMNQQALFDEKEKTRARIKELKSGKADDEYTPTLFEGLGLAMGQKYGKVDLAKEGAIITRKNRDQAVKELEDYEKTLVAKSREGIEKRRAQRAAAISDEKADADKTVKFYDEQIKKLEESQADATSASGFNSLQKQIDQLDAKRRKITGELTKEQQKYAKDAEKVGPYGSLSYWDNIARKAQEIIDKTPGKNTAVLSAQTKIKADAEKKAEDIRKAYAIKNFDDELTQKRQQYELYQRWVDAYGKEAADKQFSNLVAGNQSYLDYLNGEIRKLESTAGYTKLNDTDAGNLAKLNAERDAILGKDTALEVFNQKLQDTEDNAESLTDAIVQLRNIQSQLGEAKTGDDFEQRKALAERILNLEKQRKDQLRSFLSEVAGSEERRFEIEKYYNNLRIELDEQFSDKSSEGYKKRAEEIERKRNEALRGEKEHLLEESQAYRELEKVIMETGVKALEIKIKRTQAAAETAKTKLGEESEEYKRQAKELQGLNAQLSDAKLNKLSEYASLVGALGDALESIGGTAGEIGGALTGLTSQFGSLAQAMKTSDDGSVSMNQYAAAIQSVITMVSALISASKRRHEAERQFALERLAFEQDYQLALNQSLGETYKDTGNMYLNDIEAKIKSGVEQYQDAQKKYQEAIDKLEDAKVKKDQKNVVDGKSVGQLAGAGAAAGAVIGGIVGAGVFSAATAAVGAVIGAGVGAITGLFAKKKKDVYGGLLEEYPELIQQGEDGWRSINVELAKALLANNQLNGESKEWLENTIAYGEELEKSREQIKGGIMEMTGQIGNTLQNALVEAFKSGEDAAQAFGDTVGEIIANMVQGLLFTELMKPAMDRFVEEALASFSGGDMTIIDDLDRFKDYGTEGAEAYFKSLEMMDQWFKENGYDNPFGKTTGAGGKAPQQGAITGASQEAINILNGQITATRIIAADHLLVARSQLLELSGINRNTQELYAMRRDQAEILSLLKTDFLRAIGG